MAELLYQYSTSTAFASAVIRRLTHSRFSHIDLIIPGHGLLGVSGKDDSIKDDGGVLIRPFNCWPYKFPPIVARVQCSQQVADHTIAYATSHVGAPFDKSALYAFLRDRAGLQTVGRDWRDPNQWFCSEFQIRMAELGGLFSYRLAVTKDVVSPQDTLLLFNPYLSNPEDFL